MKPMRRSVVEDSFDGVETSFRVTVESFSQDLVW